MSILWHEKEVCGKGREGGRRGAFHVLENTGGIVALKGGRKERGISFLRKYWRHCSFEGREEGEGHFILIYPT